jgi:hypothetical protein
MPPVSAFVGLAKLQGALFWVQKLPRTLVRSMDRMLWATVS